MTTTTASRLASGNAIVVDDVEKWFRRNRRRSGDRFCALQSVSFTVAEGEFVALIGESGCGKTTLLRMVAGLISHDGGRIVVEGKQVSGVADGVGFVFQHPALLDWETVAANVEVGIAGRGRKMTRERRAELVAEQLELVGLREFAHYHPYQISGGMQQRVGLARALIGDPAILLLDEPFGALDAFTRGYLQEELARIVAMKGCASLLVTHDVEEALYLANRVVVMGSSPGHIETVIDVPGSVPRDRQAFLADPSVARLKADIIAMIVRQKKAVEKRSAQS
jgi:NitT/TauT family transport system ATP-binding protein